MGVSWSIHEFTIAGLGLAAPQCVSRLPIGKLITAGSMEFTLLLTFQVAAAVFALYASRFVKRYFNSYRVYQRIKHYPGMDDQHTSLIQISLQMPFHDVAIHSEVCGAMEVMSSSLSGQPAEMPRPCLLHGQG